MMTDEQIWDFVELQTGRKRPAVLTVKEFAELVKISKATTYRLIKTGKIRTASALKTRRIPSSEVFRVLMGAVDIEHEAI